MTAIAFRLNTPRKLWAGILLSILLAIAGIGIVRLAAPGEVPLVPCRTCSTCVCPKTLGALKCLCPR